MAKADMSKYAEWLTVVVRIAPQDTVDDPQFSQATVARLEVGADGGIVPFEQMQPAVMEWQSSGGFMGWSYVESRQRHINVGAEGADAVVLVTLLGGAAGGAAGAITEAAVRALLQRLKGGPSELRPAERAADAEQLAHSLALAIDRRRSELQLVEHRAHDKGVRAVFEDRDGGRWEITATGDLLTISRQ